MSLTVSIPPYPCWDSNLIYVCVYFTQPPSLIFIHSSKTFSQSFCQSAFAAKCHRTVALQQCIIYFPAPIINVNTICKFNWSFSIPSFSLILTSLPCSVYFCGGKCMVLTAPSLVSTYLIPKLTSFLIKIVLLRNSSLTVVTPILSLSFCSLAIWCICWI